MKNSSRFPIAFAGAMAIATVASIASVWPAIVAMNAPSDEQVRAQILRIMADPSFAGAAAGRPDDSAAVLKVAARIVKNPKDVAVVGSPKARPVVEFFDYNCGYCRRFTMGVAEPLVQDGSIRIHLVHAPILGPGSRRMAEFAAAAMLQGRFAAAHPFLSRQHAPKAEDAEALRPALIKAARLDSQAFDKSLKDGSADRIVKANERLSAEAEVSGTPVIWVDGSVSRGALTMEQMRAALTTGRKN